MSRVNIKPSLLWTLVSGIALSFVVIVYWQGLYGPFFLDDLQSIEPAQLNTFSWHKFIEISLQNGSGPLGRPIAIATFALNHYFFGAEPFSFKVVNLILHLLTGIAVGVFIYLLVLLQPKAKPLAFIIAFLTAFAWLVHPLQASTVLYPVQRMTQLCQLFILMGMNTYLVGRIRLDTQKSYAWPIMGSSLFLFGLAIFSKENGVLFVWYLFCIEYFLLKFRTCNVSHQIFLKHFHIALSLFLLLAASCYYLYQFPRFLAMFAEKNITVFDRLLTEMKVLIFYMRLILLPRASQMGLYHDDFVLSTHLDSQVITSGFLLALCTILIFYFRRKAPIISFGLAWFFISHAIESTILPLELVFEHRNYLASVGLLLIPIYYCIFYLRYLRPKFKYLIMFFFVSWMCLLMALTFSRSKNWSSADNFLKEESLFHPHSPRVHIEMANWFLNQEDYDSAFKELAIAQELQPYNAGIPLHKILIHCRVSTVPNSLYDDAIKKMRQGAVTPYVILVLDKIINNMFNHKCNSVDKKKISQILKIASQNPFLWYKPLYKAVIYHLEAGLKVLEHDVKKSRILLFKSFEVYPRRFEPLIQKAYLELQHGMYTQAEETLGLLHQHVHSIHAPKDKIKKLEQEIQTFKTKPKSLHDVTEE